MLYSARVPSVKNPLCLQIPAYLVYLHILLIYVSLSKQAPTLRQLAIYGMTLFEKRFALRKQF